MPAALKRWLTYIAKLWTQPHWWAENWSSWVITGWGISNLANGSLDRAAFSPLTQLAPVWVWIYSAVFVGSFQMVALLLNHRAMRAVAAFLCTWLLSIILIQFLKAGVFPSSFALYAGWIGVNLMAMYKLIVRGTA